MSAHKIILIGDAEAGKTNLFARMVGNPFKPDYKQTSGADFNMLKKDSRVLHIWDMHKLSVATFSKNADVVMYCIDLSKPIDPAKIKDEVDATLEKITSQPVVVLVGTKKDLCANPEAELNSLIQKLATLGLNFNYSQMTSAKDEENNGIQELLTGVCARLNNVEKEVTSPLEKIKSPYQQAKKILQQKVHDLASREICAKIDEELVFLEAGLSVPGIEAKAITRFHHNCHVILEGSHPLLINSLLSFIAVTAVTVLVGMLGFGLGVAAGLWTGPAAFLTGVLAAEAAAVSVIAVAGTMGLGLGGAYSYYGLFNKPAPVIVAVDEFVNDIQAQPA